MKFEEKLPNWYQARQLSYSQARKLSTINVALKNSLNFTLAVDFKAKVDLPPFNTSMMDGWAVRGLGPWLEIGSVRAGGNVKKLGDNEAIGISTGSRIPKETTAIIRTEVASRIGKIIQLQPNVKLRKNKDIRFKGEEAKKGEKLLIRGTKITPSIIGLAAACGADYFQAYRKPKIDLVIMGDELIESGIPFKSKVRDSLSLQLTYWMLSLNVEITHTYRIRDNLSKLKNIIANSESDIIVTTGGTAGGTKDFIQLALSQLNAKKIIQGVAVRPGKPMILAKLKQSGYLVALPGNPFAALVSFLTLVEPLILKMQGRILPELTKKFLSTKLTAPSNEHRIYPIFLEDSSAKPSKFWQSSMLRGVANSNGICIVPPGGLGKGRLVDTYVNIGI
jgi:molybdopterin molybdotransferase